jgi:hypothetical protein
MGKKMLRSFASHSIAAVFVGAALFMTTAEAAEWKGGEVGDINSSANWDGDITTSGMDFPKNGTYTLTQDVDTVIFKPWCATRNAKYQRVNVTFDMGGHTLWATNGATQYFGGNDYSTWVFTNGVFKNTRGLAANSVTNVIQDSGTGVGMSIIATGADTTFIASSKVQAHNRFCVINGAKAYGQEFYFGGTNKGNVDVLTNVISGKAELCFDSYCDVGTYDRSRNDAWFNATLVVDDATLTARNTAKGEIDVGYGAGCHDNILIAQNGASVAAAKLFVCPNSTNNAVSIRSGATVTITYDVLLGGLRIQDRPADYVKYGAKGRIEVVGAGSALSCGRDFPIRNSTGDSANAQELFVGDGATVTVGTSSDGLRLIGLGNRVVVSNGTLTVRTLCPNGMTHSNVEYPATNSTFRIEGAAAKLSATYIRDLAGQKKLSGAPIFEFAIPEGGWPSAPVVIKEAFTISDDTRIRIDVDSVKAFARAGGRTVPLIATDSSSKLITADLTKISADLPANCSLVNENGVLSAKISQNGLTIIFK